MESIGLPPGANDSTYMTPEGLYLLKVDERDTFFQEAKAQVESLVNDSLFLYVAYSVKVEEVASLKADPLAEVPLLRREAVIRGISIDKLMELVEAKATAFKTLVREVELIRTEFNSIYPTLTSYESKLELRDSLLARVRAGREALG